MKCADDMKTFQAAVMADRVYDFLVGLDDTYDKVRNDILRSDKVPSIDNVFFMRHTTCWALHGVPYWEKKRRCLKKEQLDDKAHVDVAPTPTLTAVLSTPTPPPPINFGKAFHAHDTRDTGCIIDLGATDHMTYNAALFSTTLPLHRDHILTANNDAAPVIRAGSILLTLALPLDKVLPVSFLSSNLLSMPQVTQ
ncbi:hypothetical protein L3X38_019226 [Prunus dulcis]|uniref:Retrovirus-related Pol polyprotein from transposon TNT 1-94-like beta-barrel domain-containing protein n=1 Tax=Prunus dulcis TaxID=3755 RepID=A0AAD4ZAV0_PRUDU|nr:hypothetical protein L3X38_019226 [Prunus dulcis]